MVECVIAEDEELLRTALAQQLGVTHTRYAYRYPSLAVDASHPRFIHDANRCVLCNCSTNPAISRR